MSLGARFPEHGAAAGEYGIARVQLSSLSSVLLRGVRNKRSEIMKMRNVCFALLSCLLLSVPAPALAEMLVELPAPQKQGGLSLLESLSKRHVERKFDSRPLPLQEVSNILWAACGVNREDGRLTVPTAMNYQRIGVYAVLPDGVYRYDAKQNLLEQVLQGDYLKQYQNGAPMVLLHAAQESDHYSAFHIGSMYENVALYCASAGLANVMKAQETDRLDGKLPLPDGWKVYMIQPVGYPAK